jgi:hypothetical protein
MSNRQLGPEPGDTRARTIESAQLAQIWGAFVHQFQWDNLAGLTFRYPVPKEVAIRELHQVWLRRLAFDARRSIPYFYGLERGGSGLHLHVLTAGTASLRLDQLQQAWRAGLSKIEVYDPAQGGAWYVTKGVLGSCEWYDISRRLPPFSRIAK